MVLPIFVLFGVAYAWACPESCICKWKGGKQTIECVNKTLITIPSNMDPGTQVLDFAGNNLNKLTKMRFENMGLINLQKIFLSRCRIKSIDRGAFKGLTNLVELDLSDNYITSVPTDTFHDFPSLMRLALSGNPIEILRTGAFRRLTYLTTLELSHSKIKTIEDGAFDGLSTLEWLKLDNNKIKYIKGSNILPKDLHGIDLHHNPWQCDCNLIDMRNWLLTYNVPHSIEPTCDFPPRLQNKEVKNLPPEDLACLPDVTPTTFYLEIAEGKNVSLQCRVTAIPEARVSWWYQGEVLQNDSTVAPGLHLYYFLEEGTTEKKSELFIFNTNVDDNGTFVCIAENQAGRSQSNYTIRIVLTKEPVVGLAVIPQAYVVALSAAIIVIGLLGVICIVLCFKQCRKQKRRKKKKDRTKVAGVQNQQQIDKIPAAREDTITRVAVNVAVPKPVLNQEMMAFATGPGVLVIPNNLNYTSPPVPQTFQDKNPDLINDTGSKEWNKENEDGEKIWSGGTLPRRDIFPKHLTADVHLSPGKFIDVDGYPVDYGLPKLPGPFPVVMPPQAFYRTLPHKSRQGITARFSREAECIHYAPGDVRYTAEGYPSFQDPFISPPVGYRSDAASQWPESGLDSLRTVSAQTSEVEPIAERQELTQSPDEGYVGEGGDSSVN